MSGTDIMRLAGVQASLIQQQARLFFGAHSHVWLFGSRVDDDKKGGDIDLYIEPEIQEPEKLVDARLNFLIEMHRVLGEQKIDLVLHRSQSNQDLPIYRIAKETGVKLL